MALENERNKNPRQLPGGGEFITNRGTPICASQASGASVGYSNRYRMVHSRADQVQHSRSIRNQLR